MKREFRFRGDEIVKGYYGIKLVIFRNGCWVDWLEIEEEWYLRARWDYLQPFDHVDMKFDCFYLSLSFPSLSLSISRSLHHYLALRHSTLPSTTLSSPASLDTLYLYSLSPSRALSVSVTPQPIPFLSDPPPPFPQPLRLLPLPPFLSLSTLYSLPSESPIKLINMHVSVCPTAVCECVEHSSEMNGLPAMQYSVSVVVHTQTHTHTATHTNRLHLIHTVRRWIGMEMNWRHG